MALNDEQIRPALRQYIRQKLSPELIADELPVRQGRGRIDLAAIHKELHAYEIKGQTDRLVRLQNQTDLFSEVCHRCTVVTTQNHLKSLPRHIPEWWGIVLVEQGLSGGPFFVLKRAAKPNPEQCYRSMALMFWKDELLDVFEHYGHTLSPRIRKSLLVLKLRDIIPDVDTLWTELRFHMQMRARDALWKSTHLKE